MITPYKFGKILSKLPNKKQRIELSKMQDLEDAVSSLSIMEGAFQDAYDDAQVLVIKASDIIRFDWSDAVTEAEGALQELETAFKELGVDEPTEVSQFRKQIEESESERIIADKKLDGIGK